MAAQRLWRSRFAVHSNTDGRAYAAVGLRALASRLEDGNIETLLIELDRACFAGGEWSGAALAKALSRLPAASEKKTKAARAELAELYP